MTSNFPLRSTTLQRSIAAALLCSVGYAALSSTTQAATLGKTKIASGQHKPLFASISVTDIRHSDFSIDMADALIYQQMGLTPLSSMDVNFVPTSATEGQLIITTTQPISQPFADLVLALNDGDQRTLIPKTLLMPLSDARPLSTSPSILNAAARGEAPPLRSEPLQANHGQPLALKAGLPPPLFPAKRVTKATDTLVAAATPPAPQPVRSAVSPIPAPTLTAAKTTKKTAADTASTTVTSAVVKAAVKTSPVKATSTQTLQVTADTSNTLTKTPSVTERSAKNLSAKTRRAQRAATKPQVIKPQIAEHTVAKQTVAKQPAATLTATTQKASEQKAKLLKTTQLTAAQQKTTAQDTIKPLSAAATRRDRANTAKAIERPTSTPSLRAQSTYATSTSIKIKPVAPKQPQMRLTASSPSTAEANATAVPLRVATVTPPALIAQPPAPRLKQSPRVDAANTVMMTTDRRIQPVPTQATTMTANKTANNSVAQVVPQVINAPQVIKASTAAPITAPIPQITVARTSFSASGSKPALTLPPTPVLAPTLIAAATNSDTTRPNISSANADNTTTNKDTANTSQNATAIYTAIKPDESSRPRTDHSVSATDDYRILPVQLLDLVAPDTTPLMVNMVTGTPVSVTPTASAAVATVEEAPMLSSSAAVMQDQGAASIEAVVAKDQYASTETSLDTSSIVATVDPSSRDSATVSSTDDLLAAARSDVSDSGSMTQSIVNQSDAAQEATSALAQDTLVVQIIRRIRVSSAYLLGRLSRQSKESATLSASRDQTNLDAAPVASQAILTKAQTQNVSADGNVDGKADVNADGVLSVQAQADVETGLYDVHQNDNLWRISLEIAQLNDLDVSTVMRDIKAKNPMAFMNKDSNQLRADAQLDLSQYDIRTAEQQSPSLGADTSSPVINARRGTGTSAIIHAPTLQTPTVSVTDSSIQSINLDMLSTLQARVNVSNVQATGSTSFSRVLTGYNP